MIYKSKQIVNHSQCTIHRFLGDVIQLPVCLGVVVCLDVYSFVCLFVCLFVSETTM